MHVLFMGCRHFTQCMALASGSDQISHRASKHYLVLLSQPCIGRTFYFIQLTDYKTHTSTSQSSFSQLTTSQIFMHNFLNFFGHSEENCPSSNIGMQLNEQRVIIYDPCIYIYILSWFIQTLHWRLHPLNNFLSLVIKLIPVLVVTL